MACEARVSLFTVCFLLPAINIGLGWSAIKTSNECDEIRLTRFIRVTTLIQTGTWGLFVVCAICSLMDRCTDIMSRFANLLFTVQSLFNLLSFFCVALDLDWVFRPVCPGTVYAATIMFLVTSGVGIGIGMRWVIMRHWEKIYDSDMFDGLHNDTIVREA